jgi:hypothetical protein
MKKIVGLFLILFSNMVFAETYSCSAELSNFGRSGGVENHVYVRKGSSFVGNSDFAKNVQFKILYESNTDLMLYKVEQYPKDATIFITVINKISLKFRQEYLTFNINPKDKLGVLIGKCIISK